ncbi:MAG TPA: hypothetical protein VIM51_10385 [Desulfosporosinus sp.]
MIRYGLIIALLVFSFVVQNWIQRYFEYQCTKCDGKFGLPIGQAIFSIHIMGKKFAKCPICGKWGWANTIPKAHGKAGA